MKDASMIEPFFSRYAPRQAQGLAKYEQFRRTVLQAIAAGHWEPGSRLPTETEFLALVPFSLGTIQRGLRLLVDDGIVVRKPGFGSAVAKPRQPMSDPWHLRFRNDAGDGTLPLYPTVIARRTLHTGGVWWDALGRPDRGFVMERVIGVGGEFDVYARLYGDSHRLSKLAATPVARLDGINLRQVISKEIGLPITRIQQTVTLEHTPKEVRDLLKGTAARDVIALRALAFVGSSPIYYQEFFIPQTRRELIVSDPERQ
jgi:GntR family transcriptional regulator